MRVSFFLYTFVISLYGSVVLAQIPLPIAEWTFNDGTFRESKNRIIAKPVGVKLVRDRFGNKESALYLEGSAHSYLNLGTSHLLKPSSGSISLWVNMERKVFAGRGYESNVILLTKNAPVDDFCDAYTFLYDFRTERIGIFTSKDSTEQAGVNSIEALKMNEWHHYVFSFDRESISFFIDGVCQGTAVKNFDIQYYAPDSVIVGYSASQKNHRFMRGMVDDIRYYHRVLNQDEIRELFEEPDPNRWHSWIEKILKLLGVLMGIVLISFLLVYRRRAALKVAEQKLNLEYKFHEMEIRTLKAQMNPHFIFNSLNSIQQLILQNDNEAAQKYLSKFSKLIRRLLESNHHDNLSLRDELDLLNRYLDIESLRFGNSFSYDVSLVGISHPEDIFIPHLLVQSFVENAIWHGLLPKQGEKRLQVSFHMLDEERIRCVVEDNGIGRERSGQREQTFKKKSLALSYVRTRLELLSHTLHRNCFVEIHDLKNAQNEALGTRVEVIIPRLSALNE
ncbi:MAG: histidine kinase [Chitinophagaceae bacterium]|nr:histidine kinase [Chitinophagaceae bacterium]